MILLWLRNEIDVEILIVVLILQEVLAIYGMKLIVQPSLAGELAKRGICHSEDELVPIGEVSLLDRDVLDDIWDRIRRRAAQYFGEWVR
jgi:hypothetical protein